jgi:hypothetical protein
MTNSNTGEEIYQMILEHLVVVEIRKCSRKHIQTRMCAHMIRGYDKRARESQLQQFLVAKAGAS